MSTFTPFTAERRELIAETKQHLKECAFKGGGLTHAWYVLYAALRGQDVRKTSHQPDGDNAVELLDKLIQYEKKYAKESFVKLEALEEAKDQLEAPMTQSN